jgi:hypothetical protein
MGISSRAKIKLKPAGGFAHFLHLGLVVLLPALLFVLIRTDFTQLALLLILLSKWRMLAVRPRYWLMNIRQNAVDIMVGVSAVVFMAEAGSAALQLMLVAAYGAWLLIIKPKTGTLMVAVQAFIGQLTALSALFLALGGAPLGALVVVTWLICYLSARHFFTNFEEPYGPLFSQAWGYHAAALTWVLGHWLLFYYDIVAQVTLLLVVTSFSLATLYYLHETDRLSVLVRRQMIFIMIAIVAIVLVVSDWGDKTI